ncbi:hypothetical protein [Vibrio variabilis]|uniref:hypothetical protein n=1 Tax=Vibrio variabilis TaxID=990271 RepID=UPI001EFA17FF|nr:hypothetical protein [Vibrio variabilis]
MNLGEYSVKNKVNSWLLVLLMTIGGVLAYFEMGKLEDPAFTIKEAKIITATQVRRHKKCTTKSRITLKMQCASWGK